MSYKLIEVTREHIAKGKRNCPQADPVALAIRDKLGVAVTTGLKDVCFGYYGTSPLSDKVQDWIRRWDIGRRLKAGFKFRLEVPPKLLTKSTPPSA